MKFISVKQYAEKLGVPVNTVRMMIRKGMPYYAPGRNFLINQTEGDDWIAKHCRINEQQIDPAPDFFTV